MFMIYQLKFCKIKYQKTWFFINIVNLFNLDNILFLIYMSCLALLCLYNIIIMGFTSNRLQVTQLYDLIIIYYMWLNDVPQH